MWNNALRSAISLIHSECKEEKGKKYFKEKEKQKLICCQETQKAEWVAGCAFRKDKDQSQEGHKDHTLLITSVWELKKKKARGFRFKT